MTVYADYTYYTTTYLGTVIAEADFPKLALQASQVIDRVTFQRAASQTDTDIVDKIAMAMCAVAEELQNQHSTTDGITSESQGQYSVAYGVNSSRAKSNQSKLEQAARLWLDGTFLMFAGFSAGEYGSDNPNGNYWWLP
jgi:hypothetical protein